MQPQSVTDDALFASTKALRASVSSIYTTTYLLYIADGIEPTHFLQSEVRPRVTE